LSGRSSASSCRAAWRQIHKMFRHQRPKFAGIGPSRRVISTRKVSGSRAVGRSCQQSRVNFRGDGRRRLETGAAHRRWIGERSGTCCAAAQARRQQSSGRTRTLNRRPQRRLIIGRLFVGRRSERQLFRNPLPEPAHFFCGLSFERILSDRQTGAECILMIVAQDNIRLRQDARFAICVPSAPEMEAAPAPRTKTLGACLPDRSFGLPGENSGHRYIDVSARRREIRG